MKYDFNLRYTECFDLATCSNYELTTTQTDFINNLYMLLEEFRIPASTAESIAYSLLMRMGDTKLHYHTPVHILGIFQFYQEQEADAPKLNILQELALWFHDAIYIPNAPHGHNENQSADFAISLLKLWLPQDADLEIRRHIITTAFHTSSLPYTATDEHILDLDIWSFSSEPGNFMCMGELIRQEFNHVNDEDFHNGRISFMKQMYDKPSIYRTPYFKTHYEGKARKNIQALLTA